MRWMQRLGLALAMLTSAIGFAQRGGGKPAPPPSAEEAQRAANAKQWGDAIDKARANTPPAPLPQIRFPSENEKLLGRLRSAPNPRGDLAQYLDKLWKDAKEPVAQKAALESLWHDAEKVKWVPKWVRPTIEDFFRLRSNGQTLQN